MSEIGYIVFSQPRPTPPQPGQTVEFYEIREDGTVLKPIVLNRVNGSTGQLSATISFQLLDASETQAATAEDFAIKPFTVVFEDGETSKTISIPIQQDQLPEGDEFFIVRVDDGQIVYSITISDPRSAIVKITDDDRPENPETSVVIRDSCFEHQAQNTSGFPYLLPTFSTSELTTAIAISSPSPLSLS